MGGMNISALLSPPVIASSISLEEALLILPFAIQLLPLPLASWELSQLVISCFLWLRWLEPPSEFALGRGFHPNRDRESFAGRFPALSSPSEFHGAWFHWLLVSDFGKDPNNDLIERDEVFDPGLVDVPHVETLLEPLKLELGTLSWLDIRLGSMAIVILSVPAGVNSTKTWVCRNARSTQLRMDRYIASYFPARVLKTSAWNYESRMLYQPGLCTQINPVLQTFSLCATQTRQFWI